MIYGTMKAETKKELKKKVKEYLEMYNPAGYGTHFQEIKKADEGGYYFSKGE